MLNNKIQTTVVPDGLTKDQSCNNITKRKKISYIFLHHSKPFECFYLIYLLLYLFWTPGCSIQLSILFRKMFGKFAVHWTGNQISYKRSQVGFRHQKMPMYIFGPTLSEFWPHIEIEIQFSFNFKPFHYFVCFPRPQSVCTTKSIYPDINGLSQWGWSAITYKSIPIFCEFNNFPIESEAILNKFFFNVIGCHRSPTSRQV